jgi:hypothetical protein
MLDDMAITGKDDQEHLQNLDKVLARLEEYGLRLNLDKCQFFKDQKYPRVYSEKMGCIKMCKIRQN